nr:hypothetical protein Iba_chr14aCG26710 [Ipomoea batatas]
MLDTESLSSTGGGCSWLLSKGLLRKYVSTSLSAELNADARLEILGARSRLEFDILRKRDGSRPLSHASEMLDFGQIKPIAKPPNHFFHGKGERSPLNGLPPALKPTSLSTSAVKLASPACDPLPPINSIARLLVSGRTGISLCIDRHRDCLLCLLSQTINSSKVMRGGDDPRNGSSWG